MFQVGRHYLTFDGQVAIVNLVGVPEGVDPIVIAKRREQPPTSRLQFRLDLFNGIRHIHHQSPFTLGFAARAQAKWSSLASATADSGAPLLTASWPCAAIRS
jgi:hypothetical protein